MPRLIDWICPCGHHEPDCIVGEDAIELCPICHQAMSQDWLPRMKRNAQWLTPVILHVNSNPSCPPDVKVRYPCRGDAPLPAGYERVEIRSDHDMGRFERAHGVMHHDRWFDRNGRGADDTFKGERFTH